MNIKPAVRLLSSSLLCLALLAGACSSESSTATDTTKERRVNLEAVADDLIRAIDSGDIEQVVALYAVDGVQRHPFSPEPITGRDAIRASDGALLRAFPDATVRRRSVITADSTIVVELVLVATNSGPIDLGDGQVIPATGRRIEVPSVWVLDVDHEGLIAEERAYFDSAEFFRQLGLQE